MWVNNLTTTTEPSLSKEELQQVLLLAQNNRERSLIKHVAYKGSSLSQRAASQQFGISNISARAKQIEDSITETEHIYSCIDELSRHITMLGIVHLG